jgi:hypothetical protein
MRFAGRVSKVGRMWAIEVPIVGVATRGRTKKESFMMIADAIESLVNKPGFAIKVHPGKGDYFEIDSPDQAALTAFLLRRKRTMEGLSLSGVASRLGAASLNAYARYEQGRTVPTIEKLSRLIAAVSSAGDFVLSDSQSR